LRYFKHIKNGCDDLVEGMCFVGAFPLGMLKNLFDKIPSTQHTTIPQFTVRQLVSSKKTDPDQIIPAAHFNAVIDE